MRLFTQLFVQLDRTTSVSEKVAHLEHYFRVAPPRDAAWALFFLCGMKRRRPVNTARLREWAAAEAGLPLWLVEECHETAGDLAETLALLVPAGSQGSDLPLHHWVETRLLPLSGASEVTQRDILLSAWRELNTPQRLIWNKLITGSFRIGVGRTLIVRALSRVAAVPSAVMDHRLMGGWNPVPEDYQRLLSAESSESHPSQPYPFYLAYPLDEELEGLGAPAAWQLEWKWDGIRAQLIRREGQVMIWSRGEELITDTFPDLAAAAKTLPDGLVLDGEIVAWEEGHPGSFHQLQHRLGRRMPSVKTQQAVPVAFVAYDILEWKGEDQRSQPLEKRRQLLESVAAEWFVEREATPVSSAAWHQGELFPEPVASSSRSSGRIRRGEGQSVARSAFHLSPVLSWSAWEDLRAYRSQARDHRAEGIMLKRLDSPYGVGRHRGVWWKFKVEPLHIDCVLVAAQPGHGRRAGLFTDYTFAVWNDGALVPIAKAYSGLTDEEIDELDRFVRQHATERFGPVRGVQPQLVFELAFDSIRASSRHKAGFALRFPRISRWRRDKPPAEADTLTTVKALITTPG